MPGEQNSQTPPSTETNNQTEKAPETKVEGASSTERASGADVLTAPKAEGEKAPEAKTEEGKKPEDKKPAAGDAPAPVDIKALKLPEGYEVNEEASKPFFDVINDAKLTPTERAQKLADLHIAALKDVAEKPTTTWNDIHARWKGELAKNADYGSGDPKAPLKPEFSKEVARIFDTYGTPGLREALDITGAGNNPDVVNFIYKISKELGEGKPRGGNPTNKPPATVGEAFGFNFGDGRQQKG